MLLGHTTIKLNRATMIAAVQMYLDATLNQPHIVKDVKDDNAAYSSETFAVEIDEPASVEKAS